MEDLADCDANELVRAAVEGESDYVSEVVQVLQVLLHSLGRSSELIHRQLEVKLQLSDSFEDVHHQEGLNESGHEEGSGGLWVSKLVRQVSPKDKLELLPLRDLASGGDLTKREVI